MVKSEPLADGIMGNSLPHPLNQKLYRVSEELIKIASLTDQEDKVFRLRFGLSGKDPMYIHEVATEMGLIIEDILEVSRAAMSKISVAAQHFDVDVEDIIEGIK